MNHIAALKQEVDVIRQFVQQLDLAHTPRHAGNVV